MKAHFAEKHAFTLIELLVVISVIALLISILLPALASARQAARQVQCASQVRQIALGLFMYAEDSEGAFPQVDWGLANMFTGASGSLAMRTYFGVFAKGSESATDVGALKVVLCPNHDERLRPGYVNYSSGTNLGTTYRIAAAYGNRTPYHGSGNWYGWASQTGLPLSGGADATAIPHRNMIGNAQSLLAAAHQPILGDLFLPDGASNTNFSINGGHYFGIVGVPIRRNHSQGTNVGFADGHVSFSHKDNATRFVSFWSVNRLYW